MILTSQNVAPSVNFGYNYPNSQPQYKYTVQSQIITNHRKKQSVFGLTNENIILAFNLPGSIQLNDLQMTLV